MKAVVMRRLYLREAAIMLVLARLALSILPPARIFAWVNGPLRRVNRFAVDEIGWVSWAIESLGERLNAGCLPRTLAAHAMLRRRGIPSQVCLGVGRHDDKLTAHSWLEIKKEEVVGRSETHRFVRIAQFGGAQT
jgi:hypothetical protein